MPEDQSLKPGHVLALCMLAESTARLMSTAPDPEALFQSFVRACAATLRSFPELASTGQTPADVAQVLVDRMQHGSSVENN